MKKFALKALIAWAALAPSAMFAQNLLLNGDFEAGNLNYWTFFATPNGNLGPGLPNVVSFDTAGTGTPSDAAQFQAGEFEFNDATGHTQQGGGFYQAFNCTAGQYVISADVAALDINNFVNGDAGTFSLSIDGTSVANDSLGSINPSQTIRGSLGDTVTLGAGLHIFQFEITRGFLDAGGFGNTPLEYVDNLSVTAVPEPNGLCLFRACRLIARWAETENGEDASSFLILHWPTSPSHSRGASGLTPLSKF